ncbi:meiosis-specific protein ASY1-like isoform X1 [Primulina tabacum]|uniref:meiosis-specific protein ASY1-like isoform X1 n=1 Tax=Primulina tabacum TaxID=48773 RepID=UPI003F5A5B2F
MNYVSISKLQSKLEGEANQAAVRKLIDKTIQDGFVEFSNNRRLGKCVIPIAFSNQRKDISIDAHVVYVIGKRVIHSDLTKKKLNEVKKILDADPMDLEMKEPFNKSIHPEAETIGKNHKDSSTCGGLHSISSDVTRTRGRSDAYQNGLSRIESGATRRRPQHANTPASRIEPATSQESFVPGAEDG